MTVKAILSGKGRAIITIGAQATLDDAAKMLSQHRIGAVIVADGSGSLIGMLSERDIVRVLAEHGATALERTVDQAMTRRVMTCGESDTVGEIMERMTTGRFRHLPVLEGERLIGLISIGDVVKHRIGEFEAESTAMRDYIATA